MLSKDENEESARDSEKFCVLIGVCKCVVPTTSEPTTSHHHSMVTLYTPLEMLTLLVALYGTVEIS